EFLREQFRDPVGLRDAAREAGVHPVYLARVFRRHHGCPVSEYLRALRLVEAGRLVLEGASLAHAAHAAGFADQAHVSRRFSAADPDGQLDLLRRAERLTGEEKWAEAAAAWQRVADAHPHLGQAWQELRAARYRGKDYRGALPAFARALELWSGYPANRAYDI